MLYCLDCKAEGHKWLFTDTNQCPHNWENYLFSQAPAESESAESANVDAASGSPPPTPPNAP